ncbi:hypothetical protein [Lysobacter gummosus]|uniref:hypothetical protein n=1 Tax=Lysobacter gummosus TaxID=262324 RepID=UPI00362BFFA0
MFCGRASRAANGYPGIATTIAAVKCLRSAPSVAYERRAMRIAAAIWLARSIACSRFVRGARHSGRIVARCGRGLRGRKKRPGIPGRSARTSSTMDYGLVRNVNAYALRIELIGV